MNRINCRRHLSMLAPLVAGLVAFTGLGTWASGQCLPTITGRFGGETSAFTRVNGDTLLVANGSHVELISVFNGFQPMPFSPRRIANLQGPVVKLDMTQGSGRAYALLKNGNVQVLSLTNSPGLTVQTFGIIHSNHTVDIAAAGNHVFIATQYEQSFGVDPYIDSEIENYDATFNPPVRRHRFDPLAVDMGYDRLAVVGSTLWAGFHEMDSTLYGVEGFNIANLSNVTRGAAALNNVGFDDHVRITGLSGAGIRLIVGSERSGLTSAVSSVDITNPGTPAWRPALTFTSSSSMTGLTTFGPLARVSLGTRVRTFDFTNPFSPVATGLYTDTFPRVSQMIVAGGGIDWWAGGPAGLMSMNTNNANAISLYWTLPVIPTSPRVVRQRNNTTVVLDSTLNQLHLFDYTLPESQQLRSTIQLPLYSEFVEIGEASGGFTLACVASKGNPAGDVIAVYDITNHSAPVHRSTITGFRTHLLSISSSRMYVFTSACEFKIIELAFPATPAVRSTTLYGGVASNYTAMASWSNNAAALGTASMGLWMINTTNATAPLVSAVWNPASGYRVHALAKGPGVLYVSASAGNPSNQPRLESLLVTNIAAPAQRYLHSSTSGAGSQAILESLTYLSTPSGPFLIGTRPFSSDFVQDPSQENSATLYALSNFFATENVMSPVATITLPQARGAVAPGGTSAPGGGSGPARFIASAGSAGLHQVSMPTQWAPAFASLPLTDPRVCHGDTATFATLVNGNPNAITFQWRRNGIAMTDGPTGWGSIVYGATEQALTITDVRPGDRAYYSLYATNSCGTNATYPVFLSVLSADVGMQGGSPGSDGLFDNNDFIVFIDLFFSRNPLADIGMTGGVSGRDFLYDTNDFIVFINYFFGSCP